MTLKRPTEELTIDKVLNSENPALFMYRYAKEHGKLKDGFENLFLEYSNSDDACRYAVYVVKGKWKKGEKKIFEKEVNEYIYRREVKDKNGQ